MASRDAGGAAPQARSFAHTGVRVGEWWEEAAWTEGTGGVRSAASAGSRPFGREACCSNSEHAARSSGHATSNIVDWGQGASKETDFAQNSRRGVVETSLKSSQAMSDTLVWNAAGQVPEARSGRRPPPVPSQEAPYACDAYEQETPLQPPKLYSATSGLLSVGEHKGLSPGPANLPAKQQPASLTALVGDVDEPSPRRRASDLLAGGDHARASDLQLRQPTGLAMLVGHIDEPSPRRAGNNAHGYAPGGQQPTGLAMLVGHIDEPTPRRRMHQ